MNARVHAVKRSSCERRPELDHRAGARLGYGTQQGEAGATVALREERGRGGRAPAHGTVSVVIGAWPGCGRRYAAAQGEAVQGLCSSASMARFGRAAAVMRASTGQRMSEVAALAWANTEGRAR